MIFVLGWAVAVVVRSCTAVSKNKAPVTSVHHCWLTWLRAVQ